MIELRGVTKTYGKGEGAFTALHDVSVKIASGKTVAITGKSGSGKSTMMHVMSGLDRVTSGQVLVDENDIGAMSAKQIDAFRANEMSFIFQAFFIEPNQNCLDNVMLPLEIAGVPRAQRKAKAMKALESVELADKANTRARNLSGGQKQRLAIARAIVNEPAIVFADEPTGNLDSTTGDLVTDLLFKLNKELGATLIIVTHDEELASKCAQQIRMKDGKVFRKQAKK